MGVHTERQSSDALVQRLRAHLDRHVATGRPPDSQGSVVDAADLGRIPLWLLQKPVYSLAPVRLHFRVASLKGRLEWRRYPEREAILDALNTHLGDVVGTRNLHRIAARHFQFRGRGRFARIWPQTRNFVGAEAIQAEGLHHLDEALEGGQGAILVTAHFGYARMIKPILRSRGRGCLLVGPKHPKIPDLTPPMTPVGELVHTKLLSLPRASRRDARWQRTMGEDVDTALNVRPHVGALHRNETLIILTDGRGAHFLKPLQVVGVTVYFAPGAMSLARSTGAAVLPTFVIDDPDRDGPESLRLVIHPPLDLQVTDDRNADLEANLRRFASVYEQQILAYPHNFHWTWVRDGAFSNPSRDYPPARA